MKEEVVLVLTASALVFCLSSSTLSWKGVFSEKPVLWTKYPMIQPWVWWGFRWPRAATVYGWVILRLMGRLPREYPFFRFRQEFHLRLWFFLLSFLWAPSRHNGIFFEVILLSVFIIFVSYFLFLWWILIGLHRCCLSLTWSTFLYYKSLVSTDLLFLLFVSFFFISVFHCFRFVSALM